MRRSSVAVTSSTYPARIFDHAICDPICPAAEFATLVEIELAAGRAFAEIGMPEIAADDPGSPAELAAFAQTGSVWVAADDDDRPIAYLLSIAVDDCAHIEQVSVEPHHARRGIGAALIDHLAATARGEGRAALSLTTFATCRGTPRTTRGWASTSWHLRPTGRSSPSSSRTRRR